MHYEMEDLMEQAAEVQESMSRTYGVPDELDETDLEAELDALGEEWDAEEESGIPSYLREEATELPDFVEEPVPERTMVRPFSFVLCVSVY
jgi:charged multivesicular body protein 5